MSTPNYEPLIRFLHPQGFLSFAPDFPGIELRALNVLIGPNGSGKSNLIEAVNLMRAAPRELRDVTRRGGGIGAWIWKGNKLEHATIEALIHNPEGNQPLRHSFTFHADAEKFALDDERIENEFPYQGQTDVYFYYRYQNGAPVINTVSREERNLSRETVEPNRSILAQRRDPENYPELARLARSYEDIRIYREWSFGRNAILREPQMADLRNDVMEEDFSNLGLVLSNMKTIKYPSIADILKNLKDLYEGIVDFHVHVSGGTVQVFFIEGEITIPAARLSDGTLRYLCLLTVLCDPEPPGLICIEEPELGLHPDILPNLAELLKSASRRSQLIVTTHSDVLVDALTDTPESVIVCEKHQGKTEMRRLSASELNVWLDEYSLGELWIDGELGGKRW